MIQFYFPKAFHAFFKKQILIALLLFIGGISVYGQNCSVNAGVLDLTICETQPLYLPGNNPAGIIGTVKWTQISGPSVVINNANTPNATVSGHVGGHTYVFRYSATCADGVTSFQDKVVHVKGITVASTSGNITSCPNNSGTLVISGNAPLNPGERGFWEIVGANNAGVAINYPNLPTSTITLPATSCGVSTLRWVIEGAEYAPGQRCRTSSEIKVTNYGGVTPVTAGPDQTLSNCYTTTTQTNLKASYGGCNLNGQGQAGQWTFVSGPSIPTFSNTSSETSRLSNLIEGVYVLRWTVTGSCASGTGLVHITVPPATQDVTSLSGNEKITLCDNTVNQVTLVGEAPLYAGETVQWTRVSGNAGAVIVSPTNSTTLVTNLLSTGGPYVFRYTLTNNNTGCTSTKDYTITYSGPTRTIIANGGRDIRGVCDASVFTIPLTVTGSGSNKYRIVSGPAGSPLEPFPSGFKDISGNSLTLTLTKAGNYVVEFVRRETGSLAVGCDSGFSKINILVSNRPTLSNAGTDISLPCGDTKVTLAGVDTPDGFHYWDQLSGPNTAVIADDTAVITEVTGLVAGTYVFQFITRGGGTACGFSIAKVIVNVSGSILGKPDAGIDQNVCVGANVQLAAKPPGDGEQGTWSQVSGPSTITFSNVKAFDAVASGFTEADSAYALRWTVSYLNPGPSCSAPVSDDVEITTSTHLAPTASDAGKDTCYGANTSFFNLSGNTPAPNEIGEWSVFPNKGIIIDNIHDPNTRVEVRRDNLGTFTFTWTIFTRARLCLPSKSNVIVTIGSSSITANAGPDQTICGTSATMDADIKTNEVGTWTRISGLGGCTISDIHDPAAVFTFADSGYYVFRWTVVEGACGQASDDINLTIGVPSSTPNAGPDQKICGKNSVTMDGNSYTNHEKGNWSVLSGAPNEPVIVDPTNPKTVINGLTAGTYTFRWTFVKNTVFICDAVFDDVVIEVAPTADAGADQDLCDVTSVELTGNKNSKGTWTLTSTTGNTADVVITQSPSNNYIANATVVPGKSYVFTYTTEDYIFSDKTTCPGSADTVNVRVFNGPATLPDAGADQNLCIADVNGIGTLSGNAAPVGVVNAEWILVSQPKGGKAVIDNTGSPTTTVSSLTTPGTYIFEWVFESDSCTPVSDVVKITMFGTASVAEAGPDDAKACQFTYKTAAVKPAVGIGTWSFAKPGDDPSTGQVVIDSPNNPVTTLSNITALGTYVLTWTVTNGPFTSPSFCQPSTDTVSVTFNDVPPSAAKAGPDQDLCNVNNTIMAAEAVTTGKGTWSQISGPNTAIITAVNSPVSPILGLVAGVYEFRWTTSTINMNGCTDTDTVVITIYKPVSVADAGQDQKLSEYSEVKMNAAVPTIGSGSWKQISGPTTVVFTNPASPTTLVTGTTAGTYVFEWTVANGICPVSSDQVTITIISVADLELVKTVTPTVGNAGNIVSFTIKVFNNNAMGGNVTATNVAVRDYIPAGFTLVPGSANYSGYYNLGNKTLTWSNLTIAPGKEIVLTFDATINAIGPYTNVAEIIASDQLDPDSTPGNNVPTEDDQDSATVTLNTVDLSVWKGVSHSVVSVNSRVIFTVRVTNSGPDNATGVTVLDRIPSGYTYDFDNGGGDYNPVTGIWKIGNLSSGSTVSMQIVCTVNPGVAANYVNTMEVQTCDQFDIDSTPGNGVIGEDDLASVSVTLAQADLELTKKVSPTAAAAGDVVTFTLTVLNKGRGNATGVAVRDILPAGYTLVPGSVSNGGIYQMATGALEWSNLSIANGNSMTLTFDTTVNSRGSYKNIAQITASDLIDPDSTPNNDDGDQSEDDEDSAEIIFIKPSADLSLIKTVDNATPIVGSEVMFEVVVTNNGPNDTSGVTVREMLPSGYKFQSYRISTGTYNSATGIWRVGTLVNGISETLQITAIVRDSGDYKNTAEVTASSLPDPDSTPNNGVVTEDDYAEVITVPIPVTHSADLSLIKTVSNAMPLVGAPVTFEVVVTNNGPNDTGGVKVKDLLPSGYVFDSYRISTGTYDKVTGIWSVGSLVNGKSETLQVTALVKPSGNYKNTAEVTASTVPDPNSTPDNGVVTENDYAEVITTPVMQSADLSLIKTVNNTTPLVGSAVVFEVVVTNNGPNNTSGVVVKDLLPSGYIYEDHAISTGTYDKVTGIWTVGNLINGKSETLHITALVKASGDYKNTAEVTASIVPDPNSTPDNGIVTENDYAEVVTFPIMQSADLSLIKTVNNRAPLVGSAVIFEVVLTNNGPNNTAGVVVKDLLPDGYVFEDYKISTGVYNSATGLWKVGSLANGKSETLQITALVKASGNYKNTAEVTESIVPDPNSTPDNGIVTENDYAEAVTFPIMQSADLSLTKTVNTTTPLVGSEVKFEVVVTNNGPNNTAGVVVKDLLPSGYTLYDYTISTGVYNMATGIWTIGGLANGKSENLHVTAIVNASGDYKNTAEVVASIVPDPNSTPDNGVVTENDYAEVITFPIMQSADLSVTKTASTTTPLVGSQVIFVIVVTNSGPNDTSGVVVKDLLPNGYTFERYRISTGTYDPATGLWTVGNLVSGESETLQVTGTVNASGVYKNTVEVISSRVPDPNSTPNNDVTTENDYAEVTTIPILVTQSADLSLTKTVNNATPLIGSAVTFEVVITNNGPLSTNGVKVKDLLPSGYTFDNYRISTGAYDRATGIWSVGSLANGKSETLQVTAIVNASGDYKNIAEVTASSVPDPNSTPDNGVTTENDYAEAITVPVLPTADLSLIKRTLSGNLVYSVGETVIFEIAVTNSGPNNASGVAVKDLLPVGFTYLNHMATSGSYNYLTGVWNPGWVKTGDTEVLQINTRVNVPTGQNGEYTNIGEITASDLSDPDSVPNNGVVTEDDYSSVTITINAVADLSLEKTVSNKNANVDEVVAFTLQLGNAGPMAATGVGIEDIIPLGYKNISNIDNGGILNHNVIKWSNLTVPVGGIVLRYQATVGSPHGLKNSDYVNVAQVTASDQADPDSKPNNDTGNQSEDDEDSESINMPATDIVINKEIDKTTAVPMNSEVTFSITAENAGNLAATNVEVQDVLPKGYSFISSTVTSGTFDVKTGIWSIPLINPKAVQTLTLTVKVVDFKDYLNTAYLTQLDQIDTNSGNNQDSASAIVDCFKVFNEFSPNDDQQNDTFYIECIENYPDNLLQVFNRWGNLVYFKKGYDNTWDGKDYKSSRKLPEGTYFYILDLGDNFMKTSGWLYIK